MEHFAEWRRPVPEDDTPAVSLETLLRFPYDLAHLLADKNELIYQHIYDAYPSRTDNIYTHLTYQLPSPISSRGEA